MLDRQPGVNLHEEEAAALLRDDPPRAGAAVADRTGRGDCRRSHFFSFPGIQARRRRLLEHLLVAPLHRAVALEEMHYIAAPVAEHLDLDVARPLEVALEQHAIVAERRLRLSLCSFQMFFE